MTHCIDALSDGMIAAERFRQLELYRSVMFSIECFLGTSSVKLKTIFTRSFLLDYKSFLARKGYKQNTRASYLSTLSSLYKQVAGRGMLTYNPMLFSGITVCVVPGKKRALVPDFLARIFYADLSAQPGLTACRDYFMLSVLLQGMSFIDLAYLRKADVEDGLVTYRRRKTGGLVHVPLSPEVEKLFAKYADSVKNSPYLLPLITLPGKAGYQQYQTARHRQNMQLKRLAAYLGLSVNLTTYVARHSWATTAYHGGINVAVVGQGMGHREEKTTRIYLAPFDCEELAEANRVVLNAIQQPVIEGRVDNLSPEIDEELQSKLKDSVDGEAESPPGRDLPPEDDLSPDGDLSPEAIRRKPLAKCRPSPYAELQVLAMSKERNAGYTAVGQSKKGKKKKRRRRPHG